MGEKLYRKVIINVQPAYNFQTSRVPYVAYKYSIHAEQMCISKCKNKSLLANSILVLVRISSDGNIIPCFPCHKCEHIITKYKVRRVYHS